MTTFELKAALAQCLHCEAPLVLVNGRPVYSDGSPATVTVATTHPTFGTPPPDDALAWLVPHRPDCLVVES